MSKRVVITKGLRADRLSDRMNALEKTFSNQWDKLNHSECSNTPMIYWLLSDQPNDPQPTSKRDEIVAATIIQWLGTNIGQSFLNDCGMVPRRRA